MGFLSDIISKLSLKSKSYKCTFLFVYISVNSSASSLKDVTRDLEASKNLTNVLSGDVHAAQGEITRLRQTVQQMNITCAAVTDDLRIQVAALQNAGHALGAKSEKTDPASILISVRYLSDMPFISVRYRKRSRAVVVLPIG